MSDTFTFQLKTGEMPTNPNNGGRKKGTGRYETLINHLLANPNSWIKIGPFESKKVAYQHASSMRSAAKRRGHNIASSVMPDLTLNVSLTS